MNVYNILGCYIDKFDCSYKYVLILRLQLIVVCSNNFILC